MKKMPKLSFCRLWHRVSPVLPLFLVTCSWVGSEREWNNPYDALGTRRAGVPVIDVFPNDTIIAINDTLEMSVTATCDDAHVAGYRWSFDGGVTLIPTSEGKYKMAWGVVDTGTHSIQISANNEWDMVSEVKTFSVSVRSCYPKLAAAIEDMSVSQQSVIEKTFLATDSNGTITSYFWGTGAEGWEDSSAAENGATASFKKADGGTLKVRWAARDDDGLMVYDTFNLFFNRGPDSAWVTSPAGGSNARFLTFDIIEGTGQIACSFTASDPDEGDIITYTFFCGRSLKDTALFYQGTDTTVKIDHVPASTDYVWTIHARDTFGDSVVASGEFTTAPPPSAPEGMVLIRRGGTCFQMGQSGFNPAEEPIHPICFISHFWIDSTEVTFGSFKAVTGVDLAEGASADMPVSNLSWYDAAMYCNARSRADGKDTVYAYTAQTGQTGRKCVLEGLTINATANGYRLPTEAEWELACRADSVTLYFWGNDGSAAATYAWTKENSGAAVHAVAKKKPNLSGLYDMAGNVWEWCQDWFDAAYYTSSVKVDPQGPPTGSAKVIRGGSWKHSLFFAQAGTRASLSPQSGDATIGFRTVLIIR